MSDWIIHVGLVMSCILQQSRTELVEKKRFSYLWRVSEVAKGTLPRLCSFTLC